MKNLILTTALLFGVFTLNAQNKNVLKETETKTTTIKDSKGQREVVKSVETNEVQKVELKEGEQVGKNMPIDNDAPTSVVKTTSVSVDGDLKFEDIDRTAYYTSNGNKYQIKTDEKGYVFIDSKQKDKVVLRKTANNNYFYVKNNTTAIGYFDNDGNFIIETYDKKSDTVTMEKYAVVK